MAKACLIFIGFIFVFFQQPKAYGQSDELSLMSIDTIIERIKNDDFHYIYAKFKNQEGEKMSKSDRTALNQGRMARDYYQNQNREVVEVRVRPYQLEDKFADAQIKNITTFSSTVHDTIVMSCDTIENVYDHIILGHGQPFTFPSDSIRGFRWEAVDSFARIHVSDSDLMHSAIAQCGFQEEHMEKIGKAFLEVNTQLTTYYYQELKEYANKGILKPSIMAEIEDDILWRNGFDQVYGTKILRTRLAPIEDPFRVNKRRASVGLGPIEAYCDKHGLDFDIEAEKMIRGL